MSHAAEAHNHDCMLTAASVYRLTLQCTAGSSPLRQEVNVVAAVPPAGTTTTVRAQVRAHVERLRVPGSNLRSDVRYSTGTASLDGGQ